MNAASPAERAERIEEFLEENVRVGDLLLYFLVSLALFRSSMDCDCVGVERERDGMGALSIGRGSRESFYVSYRHARRVVSGPPSLALAHSPASHLLPL